ncbi:hypothetical protein Pint_25350 [Pistacia integerrima]|uniref:Uncharacterized protein n=1 Tax=Pistacia integerrima TaxID=434235 RepID=A0ACC0YCD1_9ROSI|nr:hypothetical protein Pint_25350 [Pistacia integerrima]
MQRATPTHPHDFIMQDEEPRKSSVDVMDKDEDAIKKKIVVKALPFRKLLSYADGVDWLLMVLGTFGSVVHGMALPIGYLLLGKALDAFGNNLGDKVETVKALKKVIPFVWYMAFATFPAGIVEIGCWMYASERQLTRMRLAYLKAVLNQEIGAFDTDLTSGKIITGVSNHMSVIQDAIGEKLGHLLSSLATFFSGILIAAICCWELSLLNFLVVPMILVIGATYTNKMNTISSTKMQYLSEAASMVEQSVFPLIQIQSIPLNQLFEVISQIKTVFAFVGENSAIKSFSEGMDRQIFISKGEALIKGVGVGMIQSVTFCCWALVIWIGAVVVLAGRATGGDVLAAVMSILFGAVALTYAAPDIQIFNQAKAAGFEIFQVIERKPIICYDSKGRTLEKVDGYIDIRDVTFEYPSRPDQLILDGFSFSIPAGKMVALVGSSGCGKSTVISLVARFYDPSRGEILIDNNNIKDLDLKFLRENIGAVSQEPSLFAGTLKDNIRVGNMHATDEDIQKAAVLANAHTFISDLPDQYLTENLDQVSDSRVKDSTEEPESTHEQLLNIEQQEKFGEANRELSESTKQQEGTMNRRTIFFRIWFGLKEGDILRTVIGSVAAGFSGISKPLFGFFIMTIGVAYYEKDAKQKVGRFSLFFSLVGLFSLFTHILQHYFFGVVGEKAMINLKRALYTGVLRNELAWFEKPENNAGSLTSRIITDAAMVKTIISDRMSVIVQCISSILIATIVSAVVNWRMALVAWAVMPCHFIGGYIQAISAKGFSGNAAAAHSEFVALTSESAANIRTIASFCHEENILRKAKISLEIPKKNSRKQSIKYGLIQGVSLCLWNIAHAVALWYTTILIERNQASFKNGIRAYQIFSLTVPSITELWTLVPLVISAINVLTPVFEILDRKTEIEPDTPETSDFRPIEGEIEITQITVAHRLSTVMNCDTIVVMDKGEIVEMGSHSTLVAASQGVYSRLYQLQSFGGN